MKYLLILLSFVGILQATAYKVLVVDFTSDGFKQTKVTQIEEAVRSNLSQKEVFTLVSRSAMKQIMNEIDFQQTGMVRDKDLINLGNIAGAQYLILGTITKVRNLKQLSLRMINTETSEATVVTKTTKGGFSNIIDNLVPLAVDDLEKKVAVKVMGNLEIKSIPTGAKVRFDNVEIGKTPLFTGFVNTGIHTVDISYKDYKTVHDSINISIGTGNTKVYNLQLTDEKMNQRAKRKKVSLQVSLGTIGVGALIAGLTFNKHANDLISKRDALVIQYEDATNPEDATNLGNQISGLNSEIDQKILIRNILYGTAGAATVGFTLTFIF